MRKESFMSDATHEKNDESVTLYGETSVLIGTYVGGPLAATYMLYRNERAVGRAQDAKIVAVIGVLVSVLVFLIVYVAPEVIIDRIPTLLIPLSYALVAWQVAIERKKRYGERQTAKHAWWNVLVVALVAIVTYILLTLLIILFFSS